MTKLYDIPNNTWIDVSHLNFIDVNTYKEVNTVLLLKNDGMFSICKYKEHEIRLANTVEVRIVKNKLSI